MKKSISIKRSWLKGNLGQKYSSNNPKIITPFDRILHNARHYFKEFSEDEIRECWFEFENIISRYITEVGKRSYKVNPLIIINRALPLLMPFGLINFIDKWSCKFTNIQHPLDPYNQVKSGIKISWESALGALFILKHASIGDMYAVMDMGDLISGNQLGELKFSTSHQDAIRKNSQNAAKSGRKSPLRKLLEEIIVEPNMKAGAILTRLNKYKQKDEKSFGIISAESGRNGLVKYFHEKKGKVVSVKWKNVSTWISKIKAQIENKLP